VNVQDAQEDYLEMGEDDNNNNSSSRSEGRDTEWCTCIQCKKRSVVGCAVSLQTKLAHEQIMQVQLAAARREPHGPEFGPREAPLPPVPRSFPSPEEVTLFLAAVVDKRDIGWNAHYNVETSNNNKSNNNEESELSAHSNDSSPPACSSDDSEADEDEGPSEEEEKKKEEEEEKQKKKEQAELEEEEEQEAFDKYYGDVSEVSSSLLKMQIRHKLTQAALNDVLALIHSKVISKVDPTSEIVRQVPRTFKHYDKEFEKLKPEFMKVNLGYYIAYYNWYTFAFSSICFVLFVHILHALSSRS